MADPAFAIAVGVIPKDPSVFRELSYTDENLTQIDTWDSPAKGTLLMRKVLGYNEGDLSTVETTYSGVTMRTTLTFTNGNLVSTDTVQL